MNIENIWIQVKISIKGDYLVHNIKTEAMDMTKFEMSKSNGKITQKHWTHQDMKENTFYLCKPKHHKWEFGQFNKTWYGWLFYGSIQIQLSYGHHPTEEWIEIHKVTFEEV